MKKITMLFFILSVLLSCTKNGTSPEPADTTATQQYQLVPGSTKKISQVVGEFDFETRQPTLSRTET